MSKYEPLTHYLNSISQNVNERSFSFVELEIILGFKLPKSATEYREWWANPSSREDHPYAQSWISAGWKVDSVSLSNKSVRFIRTANL